MPDLNGVTGSFPSAPQSFTNRDRGAELRDGRQQTSQFIEQNAPQNNTVDARNDTVSSSRSVQASNAASDTSASRRQTEEALRNEGQAPVVPQERREAPEDTRPSLESTVVAIDQQLQRSAVDRNARFEAEAVNDALDEPTQPQLADVNSAPRQAEAPAEEGRETGAESAAALRTAPEAEEAPQTAEANSSVQERFTRGTAEDALGLNVNTST